MASLSDDVVDLETWQLTTLAWLCALGNLDLYFFGINKIFGSNSESSTCHLLGLARQRYSIYFRMESLAIFTTFARVATCAKLVHGKCHSLVSLFRQRTKRHGTSYEMLHNLFYRLNLGNIDRIALEVEEVANEDRFLLVVYKLGIFLESLVVACACCKLQGGYCLWVPSMANAIFAIVELTLTWQESHILMCSESLVVECYCILGNSLQAYTADGRNLGTEVCAKKTLGKSDALENLGSTI